MNIKKNCNIYPSYFKMMEAKEKSRPVEINESESVASPRIILYQKPELDFFLM